MAWDRTQGSAKSEPFTSDAHLVAAAIMLADQQEVAAAAAGAEAGGTGPAEASVVVVDRSGVGGKWNCLQGEADGRGDF